MATVDSEDRILRVKGSSAPASLASALSHGIYDGQHIVMRCIGASAVNQAVKAVAIARSYVAPRGIDLHCIPSFTTIEVDGVDMSAILVRVFPARN
jgi:stage V sporulation protein S